MKEGEKEGLCGCHLAFAPNNSGKRGPAIC